ncbi:MAG: FAD-dependent oxidoreductase [Pseudomonadota bacterium]
MTMSASARIVIIGAGMAAYSVARELRRRAATVPLLLVSSDAGAAYAKPMLSNAFALGKGAAQLVSHSAAQMAEQLNATVLTHTRIDHIDTAGQWLHAGRERIAYSELVLALGAEPIRLPIDGDAGHEVLSVNHLDDYALLRERLEQLGRPARVAILGAGLIGCEFAEDLVAGGHGVTLIDPNVRPLAALAAPVLSDGLAQAWSGQAISLRLGTIATSVVRVGAVLLVGLADGSFVSADLVVSAVGLRPSTALARASGLATARGIVVDALGRTSAPNVYALGDCAEYSGAGVLPYVAPLMAAARAIAATLAGTPTPIALKPDAVIVKTPSYKLALAPPPRESAGQWVAQRDGERTIAHFIDQDGVVRGFGMSAHTPALRQAHLAKLGQVL